MKWAWMSLLIVVSSFSSNSQDLLKSAELQGIEDGAQVRHVISLEFIALLALNYLMKWPIAFISAKP